MSLERDVPTSTTLLRQLQGPGNEAAWQTFVARYSRPVYSWCRQAGLNHGDAEEVRQAVLAKMVTALQTFVYDHSRRFRAWLRMVVVNEVRGLWRQRQRRPGDRGSGDPAVHEQLERVPGPAGVDGLVHELDQALQRDLRRLQEVVAQVRARVQERTWQAFWRTALEKEPAAEVARSLGLTVGAVYEGKRRVGQLLRREGANLVGPAEGPREDEP
jgi:RNA polymerase sigma-70 factor (ECF subfamily)